MTQRILTFLKLSVALLLTGGPLAAGAASLNGLWSSSAGGYFILMEAQGGGVLALRIDPALASGEAFLGSLSGGSVSAQSLNGAKTLALNVGGTSFSGTLTSGGTPQSISGNLLFTYAGSGYDGLWQKSGSSNRYQGLITVSASGAAASLLLDFTISTSLNLTYDIAIGTISGSANPAFRGASLLAARNLSLAFGSGSPLTGTFTAQSNTLPPQTQEQFSTAQLIALSSGGVSTIAAPSGVSLANVAPQTVGSRTVHSSSKLAVSWNAPSSGTVNHYRISASESIGGGTVSATATASASSAELSGLKAGTTYAVAVTACGNVACTDAQASEFVSASTGEEYWQLQGSGNAVSGLTKIVADGNARISATRFGAEAGSNAERIQLYYGAMRQHGLSVATTSLTTSAADPASYLSFTSLAGSAGITGPDSGSTAAVQTVATGQGVPLSATLGGKVRAFFEAQGSDGKTRIYYLDSQDGYSGRDFNSGSATTCGTLADFSSGGGCVPTLAIGVEGDAAGGNLKITNARQFKLGWPTLDDWRWDGAAGSFMVFTTDQVSGCSTYGMNHGYAVWDGTKWNVQYENGGCPKLFKSAQAMFPLHIGAARYKAYYGDPSISTGKITSSGMPFLGPKKLIYADGASSGDAATVDFEDWEAQGSARNVNFLWPDGSLLNDQAEGYIDDFHFLTPTANLDLQVMYLAITAGTEAPFSAAAVLLNP